MAGLVFNTDKLYDLIYKMAHDANIYLPKCVYENIKKCNFDKNIKNEIIKNAYLAEKKKRPLCQDCGQVVVFLEVGQNIKLEGEFIDDIINKAVSASYKDNFFRKSVVLDAFRERENTKTNTPVIIHHKIIKEDRINILLSLKGGGAENTSQIKMFNPTASEDEIKEFVKKAAESAIKYSCPPISVGVGIGGVLETACTLAKKALFEGERYDLNMDGVFDAHILTTSTHIANMPVCVNINCHSSRFKRASIIFEGENCTVAYENDKADLEDVKINTDYRTLNTDNLEEFKTLKIGDKILLSGTIYTARDAAHKKLVELINNNKKLPFDLKNSFIFYAGPAPKKEDEIIGPVGPTTSKRMDKYSEILYKKGVFGTIGKGGREVNRGLYFTATGGVACLLQDCVLSSELVAFEYLGTEAIYKLNVKNLPLTVKHKE